MSPFLRTPVVALAPVLALALGVAAAPGVSGQAEARVEAIRLAPDEHVNEVRTLTGLVDRLVSREGADEPAFYLEDDFGHQLLIIPMGETPARGSRVEVTGVVSLDPVGDPVLTVFEADGLVVSDGGDPLPEGAEEVATSEAEPAQSPDASSTPVRTRDWSRFLPWLGVGAVVLAGFWLLFGGRSSRERPIITGPVGDSDVDFATNALWPESDAEFEGRTMRFIRPDPTVRLMSARLEVVSGADAGQEIRFVARPDEPISMMFGRAPGEGPSCVTLKQKTVSRTHAVVRYRHNEWLLENLSLTNPTVLNGEELGVKERLLTDGDRIEMGEVMFVFHE